MAAIIGSLLAQLQVDKSGLASGLRAAGVDMSAFERNTNQRFQRMDQSTKARMASMGKSVAGLSATFGKGLLAGFVAGGAAGIIGQFGQIAHGIAEIGDEARRAGLSIRAFQELKFVAEQNRLGVDSLVDGIKELNLRADEFIVTGGGSAAEAFRRLGYDAATLKTKLEDPSALFTEIIGKLGQLDRAAGIRIADEVFGGTGGEKFVQLIAQGEAGIRATIQEAHRLGAVMSDEVIERAAELDRKFAAVATTVGTALKTAIVEAAFALQRFIDEFREFDQRNTESLKTRFDELRTRRSQVTAGAGGFEDRALSLIGKGSEQELAAIDAEMAEIAAELRKRALPKLRQELLANQSATTPAVSPAATIVAAAASPARTATTAAVDTEREAVARLIAELEEELRLVGASDQAKRAAEAARRAGAAATEEERQRIIELNEAIYEAEERQAKQAETAQAVGNAALQGVNQLTSAIQTGSEALDEFLAKLIEAIAQAALLGSGPLGGLFGGDLFSGGGEFNPTPGGFASMLGLSEGGYTGDGGKYEPAGVVHRGEIVWSKEDVAGVGGPRAAERLRRTLPKLPGYADGGIVGADAFVPPMLEPTVFTQHSIAGGIGA